METKITQESDDVSFTLLSETLNFSQPNPNVLPSVHLDTQVVEIIRGRPIGSTRLRAIQLFGESAIEYLERFLQALSPAKAIAARSTITRQPLISASIDLDCHPVVRITTKKSHDLVILKRKFDHLSETFLKNLNAA